ncbi:MAG: dipeptide/oligopeptide/nickel ABC transporter ATP-binding protein [Selenomonadaceae bacterium]|nr:dipeptide/oligopeptide/nickel ABC transporter ATP-binding protein [Selenomonadaceae bacterium]
MTEVLRVEHVKKFFGDKLVLNDINFSIEAGECVGLVGRSGCGKSTLAKIIARLIPCDDGKIFLCGDDITNAIGNDFYRNMQMIFQTPENSFDPRIKLGYSIAEPIINFICEDDIDERVNSLLEEVGLPVEYAERYPREISGGECQRAAIARAISVAPKLLICDEATGALDVTVQAQIISLIKKLCAERNIACLFITHDLALLPRLADKVIVMHEGQTVETGTPNKIIKAAQSPFTRQLIAANFLESTDEIQTDEIDCVK